MQRMNDQSNPVTQLFAWLSAFASAIGFTTQDVVYLIFGLVGVILSLASFLFGRMDARRNKREEEKRTRLLEKYLERIQTLPPDKRPSGISVLTDTINRISRHGQ